MLPFLSKPFPLPTFPTLFLVYFFIEIQLIYNIVLASGIWHGDSGFFFFADYIPF